MIAAVASLNVDVGAEVDGKIEVNDVAVDDGGVGGAILMSLFASLVIRELLEPPLPFWRASCACAADSTRMIEARKETTTAPRRTRAEWAIGMWVREGTMAMMEMEMIG
jgi:hypothetical protein